MTQLYALTGQMVELQALLDTDDESLKEALQNAINDIQGEFEVKADSLVRLRRNIESDVDAIDKEVERLNELKRIKKNSLSAISDCLRRNMEAANLKTIKRPLFTITLVLAPERAIIDNLDEIPDELWWSAAPSTPTKKPSSPGSKSSVITTHRSASAWPQVKTLRPNCWINRRGHTWSAAKAQSGSNKEAAWHAESTKSSCSAPADKTPLFATCPMATP